MVLRLLERLDAADIPVASGRETPLEDTHEFADAWRECVDAGYGLELGPTERTPSSATSRVDLISDLAAEHDSLDRAETGPLTNLADALGSDPSLAERIGPVFIMGGALHVPGNLVCCGAPRGQLGRRVERVRRPDALNDVDECCINPSLVSLDATNQVPLRTEFARRVMERG